MEEIDASLGQYVVYYPAAMQESEGAVDVQFMVSWDDKSISIRAFTIRVEPVIIGGTESEGGCTITITDKNGTTTADVAKGVKGDKGDTGETGATGPTGPQGPAGTTPDLSAYATKQYVDDAIAALANLEEEEF